jgi:hypothetical protein
MSGAPFRDLFVELPRALFETIKGIGEHAIRRAQAPGSMAHLYKQAYPASARVYLASDRYIRLVFERYGWRSATVVRLELGRETEINVKLSCGHRASYVVDEIEQVRTERCDEIALLDRIVDETGTRCSCVREHGRR